MGIWLPCWHPLSWIETILTLTITLTIESLGELPRLWKHEAQCDCKCLFLWHPQLCNKNNPENCQDTWPFNIGIGLIQYRLTMRKQERVPFLKNLSPNWRLGLQSWGCDSLVIITTISVGMSLSSLNKMICLNYFWRNLINCVHLMTHLIVWDVMWIKLSLKFLPCLLYSISHKTYRVKQS